MRPKLLQIGQTRQQSTPFYVYIQNIKLVWNSDLLRAGLEQENVLYAPPNTKSMVDRLSFCKPMRVWSSITCFRAEIVSYKNPIRISGKITIVPRLFSEHLHQMKNKHQIVNVHINGTV